jgi:hypothetical protein
VNGRSSSAVLAHSAGKESTQRKKRKLENDGKASGAIASEHKYGGKKARRTDLELLYEPWLLLPASLRSAVANSLTSWEDRIVPVVFTRNQNIKAGINKLKAYMGDDQSRNATAEEKLWAERLAKGDALLAVSAQAEATTKLVGIIGMAKRILAPSENQPGAEGDTWYSYTSLSSQVMQKRNPDKAARKEDAKDDDPFDSLADIQTQDSENSRSMLTVPLLTVWVSRARIPPFRDAFGEQTFRVAQMNGHG